ncbi:MAG: hypothetical protein Q8Q26_09650 [Pseudorhodobacter sp.]|nr:hypothetical protein [Pseudorhodobacter sp.]
MADSVQIIRAMVGALVARLGCYDAVAETINAALPGARCCKGTIAKRVAGQIGWPVCEVMALEDALGVYPVTRFMARRLEALEVVPVAPLVALAGAAAREGGEAVAAMLAAVGSAAPDAKARAVAEIDEGIAALVAARAALEGGQ